MYSDDEPPVVPANDAIFIGSVRPIIPAPPVDCTTSPRFFISQPAEKKQKIIPSKSLFSDVCIYADSDSQRFLERS